jgi:hypothetical protein
MCNHELYHRCASLSHGGFECLAHLRPQLEDPCANKTLRVNIFSFLFDKNIVVAHKK